MTLNDYSTSQTPTWCPGCGNFGIWAGLRTVLAQLNIPTHELVISHGVGCAGNGSNFFKSYGFHGLHGRAVPVGTGIKLANHKMNVVVMGGDGDGYGIGVGHLIHACRRNIGIKYIVHDNQIYGLTTGQTSPTSEHGFKTKSTPSGVIENPVNPIALALSSGATFVARTFSGDMPHLLATFKAAFEHKGFALVDVFQPCVTFNHLNTFQYFRDRCYHIDEKHDKSNLKEAFDLAYEVDKLPIGVFYQNETIPTYEESLDQLKDLSLVEQSKDLENINIEKVLDKFT